MNELTTMSPEALRKHIKQCQELLKNKENERFDYLVGEVASAAQRLINEYPHTAFFAETYCEGCEQRIDVRIELDHLTFKDNYEK